MPANGRRDLIRHLKVKSYYYYYGYYYDYYYYYCYFTTATTSAATATTTTTTSYVENSSFVDKQVTNSLPAFDQISI